MEHSLEYYRQAAADSSDDSDCDLLKLDPVFQSRKKPKQHETDSPSSIVSLSQSSLESNSSAPRQQAISRKPALSEEQIEAKAQELIKGLKYPGLGDTNRADQLGWHKAPKQKRAKENTWYPCRLCKPDERIGLMQDSSRDKIMVRYLGYQSDTAHWHAFLKEKEYIPLTLENKESGMDTYIRHLKKHFKDDEVGFRAEILAVREMWRTVQEREETSISKAKSTTKKATKTQSKPSTPRQATLNRKLSHYCESSDEGNSDNDLDLYGLDKRAASKRIPLKAGDVIEYYDPIGVAGKSQWLKSAIILGVVAKAKKFPLNLDSGDLLDRQSRIKRVKRLYKGKLKACQDATFKDVNDYGLRTSGTTEMIGINTKIQKAKQIRKDFAAGVDNFWKAGSIESNEDDKATSNSNATVSTQIRLPGLLQHIQNEMATNPQYDPPIRPEQLDVVMRVRECLQQKIDVANDSSATIKSIIPFLATRLQLELESLDKFLNSIEDMNLSDAEKMEVIKALQSWLEDPSLDISHETLRTDSRAPPSLAKEAESRRMNCPLATRNQNTHKKESRRMSPRIPKSQRW
ncbi:unnamed protein product [Cylindrotheca closterium]|uniref:Uncharacterized protein n=1 Tax=Cylindrotheca closterium TaxID=2856 RepID=A0AAD2CVT7_9STRA|nr:unnamed protein product [Cylindrotheca closterium]